MISSAPRSSQTTSSGALVQVLVVEDEFLIAGLIADQLEELGYAVVGPALSMVEARRLAQSATIDCALLDWSLAGASTGEVADILGLRHIPYVFASGYAELPDASRRKTAILKKPFSLAELQQAVETALQSG